MSLSFLPVSRTAAPLPSLPPYMCNRAANRSRLIFALLSQELTTRPDEDHWLFRVLWRQRDTSFEERGVADGRNGMAGSLFVTASGQWCLEGDPGAMARTPCQLYVGTLRKTRLSIDARLTRIQSEAQA